jgi:hypothetical protein
MDARSWLLAATSASAALLLAPLAAGQAMTGPPVVWPDATAIDCPFPRSTRISAEVKFTGKYAVVPGSGADTWYPSWASDGVLYSTFADGTVNGVTVQGYGGPESQRTGHARIDGDDPTTLKIQVLGTFLNNPTPYAGRYPSASLAHNGVWYYGTYTLDDLNGACHNWCGQGPFVGFRQSTDGGKNWVDSKYTPADPVFGESGKAGAKVKFGPVHMVDFGKNMEHSPDGRAYFVSHGAVGTTGLANWIAGDAVYLGRVAPTPQDMDNRAAFEFYNGAAWSHDVAEAKPIVLWPGRLGSVTVTYDAPAKVYLMWVSRPHEPNNNTGPFDTLLLEADQITGPWRIVTTWANFGSQAYFVNAPSKFISADGKSLWLLYSANFSSGNSNPPGSGYNFGLHELTMSITALPPNEGGAGGGDSGIDASIGHTMVMSDARASDSRTVTNDDAGNGGGAMGVDATEMPDPGVADEPPIAAEDPAGCACRESGASREGAGSALGGVLLMGAAIAGRRRRVTRPLR